MVEVQEWIYDTRGYFDRGKFRLLIWAAFIGYLYHPVVGEEMG